MKGYLIDTHILIWYLFNSGELPDQIKRILRSPENTIYVSLISFWEIAIKFRTGKLNLGRNKPEELIQLCNEVGFEIIFIDAKTILSSHNLVSDHHKDPFDRLLIWHAIQDDLILITNDQSIPLYRAEGLQTLW